MVVCKIITNLDACESSYKILDKLSNTGSFLLESNSGKEDIIYFASTKDEIDLKWVQKAFSKKGLSSYVHEYKNIDDLDLSVHCNQWVAIKLNDINTIIIHREKQKELQKINRRIDLVDKVLDAIAERQKAEGEDGQNAGIYPEEAESIKEALRK